MLIYFFMFSFMCAVSIEVSIIVYFLPGHVIPHWAFKPISVSQAENRNFIKQLWEKWLMPGT